MDINICVDKLGLNRNRYKLDSVFPPHSIEWWEGLDPQPTEEELQSAWDSYVAEQAATQYQRDRKAEYPAIEELIVALAEFQEGRPEMWYEVTRKRTEVKAKYPKP